MITQDFKYTKSYRIPYRGCHFDSLLELKYALSIEDEYRYLHKPVIIGYDPKTMRTTSYFRETTRMYTPDFLVRHKSTGEATLVEIKPDGFELSGQLSSYTAVGNNYIEQNDLPWTYKIIFEKDFLLDSLQQQKFLVFVKKKKIFKSQFALQQLDRKYNKEPMKYSSHTPWFPEDTLDRKAYARFVRLGT
jgi:hypothetical protein